MKNKRLTTAVIIVLLGIALILFLNKNTPTNNKASSLSVSKAFFAKNISSNGQPLSITKAFNHSIDRNIYLFLKINNLTKNTQISYIRYYNNYYIDSYSIKPNITTGYVYFNWDKTHNLDYPKGTYSIKIYINNIYQKTVSYTVN